MSDGYLTAKTETESVTIVERSKFICRIKPIDNENEAKRFIATVRKEHSLATHNCYAYIADESGLIQKFSDDGEPQGTAGMPMLETLKNRKIYKVVAVVTRYFGGIKLGTGGLSRAYGGAVSDCLDKCGSVNMRAVCNIRITSDYDGYSKLLKLTADGDSVITATEFSDKVVLTVAVKTEKYELFKNKLSDVFKGKQIVEEISRGYCAF